jgi:hypothetical protein
MSFYAPRLRFPRLVLVLCCTVAALIASVKAQVPGRNVNMVTGGTFPGGDPSRQKQNEPSIAVSTRNPCHLLAGANDYRAVELPGLPDDKEIGDAWVGWYESTDCGATWYSTLVPGYPQDASAAGLASPVKGLSAGADPVVRSGPAGQFYYLFIAFNRGTNVGSLALARGIDHNDRDPFIDPDKQKISPNGATNPRAALSPIQYTGTTEIAKGSGGRFVDKPSLAVFPAASGTCLIDGENVPATNVYTAWTEFVGNNPENLRSKVYFARSADCGKTLAGPATKLSEGYPLGTGTVIGVNPNNPNEIYVVWRQIRNDKSKDALLFARSSDGGRSFTKAEYVPGFGEGQFAPFDQSTTSTAIGNTTTTFRTTAYPTVAWADDGFLYMAVQRVPGLPTGALGGVNARIVLTRTAGGGGAWDAPVEVASTGADGQQFMPSLAYAAGKLQLIWYDVRFDEAEFHRGDALIDEKAALATAPKIRRTMDLLGAQASLSLSPLSPWPLVFNPYGVAQPDYNDVTNNGTRPLRGPRISQYLTGDPLPNSEQGAGPRQLQFNRGNLLLYGGGTIAFIGDYIDIQGTPFVLDVLTNKWVFNGLNKKGDASFATFHATWTDNRDAGVGKATTTDGRLDYSKPTQLPANATIDDASCPLVQGAVVDNTGTRDANVYTSRISNEFSLTLPTNSKPTNTPGVVRAFPVQLANNLELTPGATTPEVATRFKLKMIAVGASFSHKTFRGAPQAVQGSPGGCDVTPGESPLSEIFVDVLPRSSAARTVYVRCTASPALPIVVTATRMIQDPITHLYSDGPSASVTINGDPSSPGAKAPNGTALGVETHNPDAENPDAENPDAENPDAENPDAENPDAENPDAENPDAENPDAENPDAENPDAENPDAENPDAENANFQDVTVDVTNDGDTTSGYQVNVQTTDNTGNYSFLLMARRVTASKTSINCALVNKYTNQTLFAIPLTEADLNGTFVDPNSADVKNPTFLVRPGESIKTTLRIVSKAGTPQFCSTNPDAPDYCFEKLRFKTRAQAPNTGELQPREDAQGNVTTTFLSIVSQPTDTLTTDTIGGNEGSVAVRASDGESSVAGVPVTMSLATNPGETALGGTVTQLTNSDGYAIFNDLRLDTAASGYKLRASAPDAHSLDSDAFDIDVASGSVQDGTGDAVSGLGPQPYPDLVSSTLNVNEGNLNVSVRYANGTFNASTTMVTVSIDVDEDPATGSPGVDTGCQNDAAIMGVDYIITTGGILQGANVSVLKYVNTSPQGRSCSTFPTASSIGTATLDPNGFDFVVPLSALGGDAGRLKFKVTTATSIPNVCPTCSTSVQDYMPNVGQAPGQVPTPIFLFMH